MILPLSKNLFSHYFALLYFLFQFLASYISLIPFLTIKTLSYEKHVIKGISILRYFSHKNCSLSKPKLFGENVQCPFMDIYVNGDIYNFKRNCA